MQAYRMIDLWNKYIREEAEEALGAKCIGEESHTKILQAYPCQLYTPNYFIRIALALLTFVAVIFSGLLLWLITAATSSNGVTALCIFLALSSYFALEFFARRKYFYNAGVDNMLMLLVITFIVCAAFSSHFTNSYVFISSLVMSGCLWLSVRFTDAFMAAIAYIAFFICTFLLYIKAGAIAKATAPLMMMAISAGIYFLVMWLAKTERFMYRFPLKVVTVLTLITFYASGNYFVVKEAGTSLLNLPENNPVPFAWIFWFFTITIPPAYIAYGIFKKNILFIRTGLILIAATIFTIRYYHAILPWEVTMLTGGAVLLATSYALIKALETPKRGFSIKQTGSKKNSLNAEALVIAQTFGHKESSPDSSSLYGGGTGGGGGASGDY